MKQKIEIKHCKLQNFLITFCSCANSLFKTYLYANKSYLYSDSTNILQSTVHRMSSHTSVTMPSGANCIISLSQYTQIYTVCCLRLGLYSNTESPMNHRKIIALGLLRTYFFAIILFKLSPWNCIFAMLHAYFEACGIYTK